MPPIHRVLDNYSPIRATVHTLEVGGRFGTGRVTQSCGVKIFREKETSKTPFFPDSTNSVTLCPRWEWPEKSRRQKKNGGSMEVLSDRHAL